MKKVSEGYQARSGRKNALFDDFLPHPSLSTTSSVHATRCLVRLFPPVRCSAPTGAGSATSSTLPLPPSSRGAASVTVSVREPSPGAEVLGLRWVARYAMFLLVIFSFWIVEVEV